MPTIGGEISVSTANGYITSFITNYFTPGNVPVKSFFMDAQLIRDYLANPEIKNVKFVLGESPLGESNSDSLTLILVGVDSNDNYVKTVNGNVLDEVTRCPPHCQSGQAANDLII